MRESPIQQRILFALGTGLTRLFRVNTGIAYAGSKVDRISGKPRMVMCYPGDAIVRGAQPIRMGLCNGGSDLIGWTTVDGVAVFTAIEVKAERGRVSPEQQHFIDTVKAAGGIAGVARSEDEARLLLTFPRTGG